MFSIFCIKAIPPSFPYLRHKHHFSYWKTLHTLVHNIFSFKAGTDKFPLEMGIVLWCWWFPEESGLQGFAAITCESGHLLSWISPSPSYIDPKHPLTPAFTHIDLPPAGSTPTPSPTSAPSVLPAQYSEFDQDWPWAPWFCFSLRVCGGL